MTNQITLPDALLAEIRRNRELMDAYQSIGAPGEFAHALISAEVALAENALASGEPAEMIRWLQVLQRNKA